MDLTRRDILKKSAMGGAGLAAIPGLAAFLEACSSPQGGAVSSGGGQTRSVKLAVVTHGQGSDPFWSVVKNGVTQAGKDMGASVTYDAPPTFDMVAMSQLIDAQVAKKPDGLIVSIPDASALSKSITSAVSAGIPVVSMNSGSDVYKQLGILTHIGQTEELAGMTGGEQMCAAGVRNGLVVNQQQYLQGYLPIVFLTLSKPFLLMPGGGQPVLTGPALVKKDTAAKVIDLSKRGIR